MAVSGAGGSNGVRNVLCATLDVIPQTLADVGLHAIEVSHIVETAYVRASVCVRPPTCARAAVNLCHIHNLPRNLHFGPRALRTPSVLDPRALRP